VREEAITDNNIEGLIWVGKVENIADLERTTVLIDILPDTLLANVGAAKNRHLIPVLD